VHADDWIYRVRPNDNIWSLSRVYLRPGVSWQRLQQYNHVADPYHLPPGMPLHFPVSWLSVQPADATIVAVSGDARVMPSGAAAPNVAVAGMKLGYGTHLETGTDASLTLQFADGSRVLMQGDSALDLDRMSAWRGTGMVDTRLRLQRGRVASQVTPMRGPAAHFSVETPGIVSSVRGTHFRIAADAATHSSRAEVLSGGVGVAGGHRHVLVTKGHGVAVADGHAPGAARALLPAPRPACPAQPVTRLPFVLRWPALAGARGYRVQMAANDRFESLQLDRTGDSPHIALADPADGDYALRVHGIDDAGLEGMDAVCTFSVAAHPQPPLVIAPQADAKVRDAQPTFRWSRSEGVASYELQLAQDEGFARPTLARDGIKDDHLDAPEALPYGRYYWRVASRDANGKLGPYSDAVAFDRVAEPPAPALDAPRTGKQGLDLSWPAGASGQHYRIQYARDRDFAHPEVDRTLEEARLHVDHPGHGTRYVRVRTIDVDGYAGPWGPTQTVELPCKACSIAAAIGGGAVLLWLLW
jgi:hypothetical protein